MSTPRKRPFGFAWKSACAICRAIAQCCYSAGVLLLLCCTLFAAYVAMLDTIPVPNFIVREFQNELRAKGLSLRLQGVHFQPNGRVIVETPELYAPEFGSTVFAAQQAVVKIGLPQLLIGQVVVEEVLLDAGRFVLPAMLTPSGVPTTAVSSINLEATLRNQRWHIHYANAAISGLKVSLAGRLDPSLLQLPPPPPDAPPPTATELILDLAPKIARLQEELTRFTRPFCIVDLDIERRQQVATVEFGAERLRLSPEIRIHDLAATARYRLDGPLDVQLESGRLTLPQEATIASLTLSAAWPTTPTPQDWLPQRIHASATNLRYGGSVLPSLLAQIEPGEAQHTALLQFALPDAPIQAVLRRDNRTQNTALELRARLDTATLEALAPLAQTMAQIDPLELARLPGGVDLQVDALFDPQLKPISATTYAVAGKAEIMGAGIDFATAAATLTGPQIDANEIRMRSGEQFGVVTIGYNLDTRFRRILVEGQLDPTLINGWFKPWWAAMWEGMTFPDNGMLAYLDSQATFLRPDTVRVTGLAYGQDLDLRGIPVKELRTRIFSLFRYVDLYELELYADDGQQAAGEIQFHMARDTRDEKDKLTGIWIDAISTLDVKIAPDVLWEISEAAANILAPYCYHLPPLIEARTSSVRVEDQYTNDIALRIESDTPFSFYGFPFETLHTDVRVGDDLIDIPNAQATLGGGLLEASAFIVGDGIELDAQLEQAGFGETLVAANTYFARNPSPEDDNAPDASPEGGTDEDASDPMQTDAERLLAYGGLVDAHFQGGGITGDPLSYVGSGAFEIQDADFGKFQLFGLLSMALEVTPLRFTTLKFDRAAGPFAVDRELVRLSEATIEGSVAAINAEGAYNIDTEALDFKARLYPFRNSRVPIISPLINLPLNIVSNVFEVTVSGTFDQPRLRLFNPTTKEEIGVEAPSDSRNPRPAGSPHAR